MPESRPLKEFVTQLVSTLTPELTDLNARRRRAVQLRVDGRSLSQIQTETGLSVPTILQAYRAFSGGGWQAIDVGSRGRPKGDGRVLNPEQEARLRQMALHSRPEQHGLPARLWDLTLLSQWTQHHLGQHLPDRSLARLLARWGLSLLPLRELAERHAAGRQWLAGCWEPALKAGQVGGPRPLWVGDLRHPELPAPSGLLVAVTPRGSLRWLAVGRLAQLDSYLDFLGRLDAEGETSWDLHLQGPALDRLPALAAWLQHHPRLQVQACPVQPVARQPAEHVTPVAPATQSAAPAASQTGPQQVATPQPPSNAASRRGALPSPSLPRTDPPTMSLTHLQRLEAESIHIMREVVAETENPVMMYSIGKDSAVMLHLARKAFFPSPPPFPLLHVDTTWKFRAMYEMRDRVSEETGMKLLVHQNPEAQELGINPFTHGSQIHTDMWKTQGLKQALDKYNFDAAFGGARRDEEKSRAKERIFSFRSAQHRWDPKNQRPELWRLYNGRKQPGESIRVFPISNWTELDVWQYIAQENIPIVPLYFSAPRPVVDRDGTLIMVDDERFPLREGEVPMMKNVRFRTLGCYPLSGAVESEATTLNDVIQEMLLTKTSERQGRMIDHDAAASMEKKKQEGYF
jgi:sulfate adenylyltransferase subunit 2